MPLYNVLKYILILQKESVPRRVAHIFTREFSEMKAKSSAIYTLLFLIVTAAFLPAIAAAAEITSVDITVKAPLSGTVVKGNALADNPRYDEIRQTPQPEVILPSGADYELWIEEGENYGLWCSNAPSSSGNISDPFTGRMTCGSSYIAEIYLKARGNHTFADDCAVKVNKKSPVYVDPIDADSNDGIDGLRIGAVIQPAHAWSWITKSQEGLLKNGIRSQVCSDCGAEQNVVTVSGYASYYVKSLKVIKGKKSFTVQWKKQSRKNRKKFNGYQIRYSMNPDMSNAKTVTAGKGIRQKKIKNLMKKTRYYVQVRTYTKTTEGIFYSRWSPRKRVKTK